MTAIGALRTIGHRALHVGAPATAAEAGSASRARPLAVAGAAAAGAALLGACSLPGPTDDATEGAAPKGPTDTSRPPKPGREGKPDTRSARPDPAGPALPDPAKPAKALARLPIKGSEADVALVEQGLRAARSTTGGARVIEAARRGDVRIQVLPSTTYDRRNGSSSAAVAKSSFRESPDGTRSNVRTVVEVDAGGFRAATQAERASLLAHELQHAVDARDPRITNAESEARAYTLGDRVQTALGQEPGREALSRHDRTGRLLRLDEIARAVCEQPSYVYSYAAQGVLAENCGRYAKP